VSASGPIAGTVIQTRPGQLATLPVVPIAFSQETASDLVLMNGTILTLDNQDSIVSAVKIQDGRIVAVGDDLGEISPSAIVIDLGGRTVTPGLIDTHIHYFRDSHIPGYHFSAIETVFTIPDLLDALAVRAASVPVGEFITVMGRFIAAQFAENRLPTLAELDGAAPDHPVYLHSGFSGPAVTNTPGKAFFEAGGLSVDPSGAFNRGQTDPPVQALFGDYSNGEALRTVREYMHFSASLGLTTIQKFSGCGGSFGAELPAAVLCEGHFFDLWQQGALRVRIRTSAGGFGNSPDQNGIYGVVLSTQEHLQELQDLGGGDDMLRFTATGEFVIGNFGSTSSPFADAYLQIAEQGWSLRQHSISSGENEAHISAFETVNATVPIADLRWAVEHIFSISSSHIDRLQEIGAGVTVQNQQYLLGGSGPPYRDLLDGGIPIGGGTDSSAISPLSPWISLYHMVTGKNAAGTVTNDGQQISRMEALRLYTTGSAYFTFDDTDLGSIEVGKLADLVVLSEDYLSVAEEEIRTLSSVLTLSGGEIVHAAAEFSGLDP
jgi:predicted amidohydrolase YtcJ